MNVTFPDKHYLNTPDSDKIQIELYSCQVLRLSNYRPINYA